MSSSNHSRGFGKFGTVVWATGKFKRPKNAKQDEYHDDSDTSDGATGDGDCGPFDKTLTETKLKRRRVTKPLQPDPNAFNQMAFSNQQGVGQASIDRPTLNNGENGSQFTQTQQQPWIQQTQSQGPQRSVSVPAAVYHANPQYTAGEYYDHRSGLPPSSQPFETQYLGMNPPVEFPQTSQSSYGTHGYQNQPSGFNQGPGLEAQYQRRDNYNYVGPQNPSVQNLSTPRYQDANHSGLRDSRGHDVYSQHDLADTYTMPHHPSSSPNDPSATRWQQDSSSTYPLSTRYTSSQDYQNTDPRSPQTQWYHWSPSPSQSAPFPHEYRLPDSNGIQRADTFPPNSGPFDDIVNSSGAQSFKRSQTSKW